MGATHATAAGDVDAAVELVARHYEFFVGQGQLATTVSVDADVLRARPAEHGWWRWRL